MYISTCFGSPHVHHQELNNCSSSLWFFNIGAWWWQCCWSWSGRLKDPTTTNSTATTAETHNQETARTYCQFCNIARRVQHVAFNSEIKSAQNRKKNTQKYCINFKFYWLKSHEHISLYKLAPISRKHAAVFLPKIRTLHKNFTQLDER
jgi:hypothetical protein